MIAGLKHKSNEVVAISRSISCLDNYAKAVDDRRTDLRIPFYGCVIIVD
jgi:hypothetical protein